MKRLRIMSHGPSTSLDLLVSKLRETEGLDVKKLKRTNSTYRHNGSDVILNYGCSSYRSLPINTSIFNCPSSVSASANKLHTFQILREEYVPTVEWTTSFEEAKQLVRYGSTLFARTVLTGSQGAGIEICHDLEDLVTAPLYTVRFPALRELRVHVFDGQVVSFAVKKQRNQESLEELGLELNREVRNLAGGWVFCSQNETISPEESRVAIAAVAALGLDFGAVDLLTGLNSTVVLEVNTAPGLEGSTLDDYSRAVIRLLEAE